MDQRAAFLLAAVSATSESGLLIWAALRRYADIRRLQARVAGSAALVVAAILAWLGTAIGADPDEAACQRVRRRLTLVAVIVGILLVGIAGTALVINLLERSPSTGDAPVPEAPAETPQPEREDASPLLSPPDGHPGSPY